jgi:uncharacterized protein YoxC
MPDSTLAGIITSIGTVFTAISLVIAAVTGLIRSRKIEAKVDTVHTIVNSQRTDMQRYIRAQTALLEKHGITPPIDQSIDPNENKSG